MGAPGQLGVLASLIVQPTIATDLVPKSPLELILFSDALSSCEAEAVRTDQSSSMGQMLCMKTVEVPRRAQKRVSSCLLDRSLYERLTRLITLLPKQCPIVSHPTVDRRAPNPRFPEGPRRQRPEYHPRHRLEFTPRNEVFQHFRPVYPEQIRPANPARYRHPQQPAPLRPNPGDQYYQTRGPPRYNAQQHWRNPNADPSEEQHYQRGPKSHPPGKIPFPYPLKICL